VSPDLEALALSAADACPPYDWPAIIEEIDHAGLCMAALARACRCSEPSIAALRRGRTQEPRDLLARRILAVRECVLTVPHETYSSTENETV
jgi:hypothetical protein